MGIYSEKLLTVTRTHDQAKENYDKVSRYYDFLEGVFEKKAKYFGIKQLNIKNDEIFLEIGFGTGLCLRQVAERETSNGKVYGIDLSSGMLRMTEKRLKKYGLLDRVNLFRGDAMKMPYPDNFFDVVFMSFTLELFDTPEIPFLLTEIKRILKKSARIGIVSLLQEDHDSLMVKLYKWAHKKYPKLIDCRPIYPELFLNEAGFSTEYKTKLKIAGLPVEVVIGVLSR